MLKNKGDIILQGDFNARIGQKNDFIQPDPFLENLFENLPTSQVLKIKEPTRRERNF